jgi:DedD protein
MSRGFGGTAIEPMEEARDRELTLGPAALIAMALGLCGLCVMCFLWGYSIGHRGSAEAGSTPAPAGGPTAAQILSGQAKPAANQGNQAHVDQSAQSLDDAVAAASPATNTPSPANASYPASSSAHAAGDAAVVKTALPAQAPAAQAADTSGQVQTALGQGVNWMVQIAAVSHTEDADVLVSALRKRGYVVSSRRDPADNLLHVQVGPFATHGEASAMRTRLLNDGYNAIIEP